MSTAARPKRIAIVRGPKQRLAEAERRATQERAAVEAKARQDEAEAYEGWLAGRVVPHRITLALDIRALYGPEVDEACGAKEPDVDDWEAGRKYPTWEQLTLLAALTGFDVRFFIVPKDGEIHPFKPGAVMFVCDRSRKNWNPRIEIPEPILTFTREAIAAAMQPHYEQTEIPL